MRVRASWRGAQLLFAAHVPWRAPPIPHLCAEPRRAWRFSPPLSAGVALNKEQFGGRQGKGHANTDTKQSHMHGNCVMLSGREMDLTNGNIEMPHWSRKYDRLITEDHLSDNMVPSKTLDVRTVVLSCETPWCQTTPVKTLPADVTCCPPAPDTHSGQPIRMLTGLGCPSLSVSNISSFSLSLSLSLNVCSPSVPGRSMRMRSSSMHSRKRCRRSGP